MKKLMIAAAIVCAVAVTQAASVEWGSTVGSASAPYTANEGQVALLLYSTAQGALATTLDGTGIGARADNGYVVVDTHTLTAGEVDYNNSMFLDTFDRTDADGGVNGWYQIVLLSDDKARFDVVAPNNVEHVTGIADSSGGGFAKFNTNWATSDVLGGFGYNGTVAVPEPTSGLLLLLGVAGLALKRKRA